MLLFFVNILMHSKVFVVRCRVAACVITFRVSRKRREMYCGHPRLCVCLFAAACPHYCADPDLTWGVVGDAP